jgi:hypothetical protein
MHRQSTPAVASTTGSDHTLIHDAAYQRMPNGRASELHERYSDTVRTGR